MTIPHFGRFIRLKLRLLGWLQRQCVHPPELVSVDIACGELETEISWCLVCGAAMIRGGLHEPRADWWIDESIAAQMRLLEEQRRAFNKLRSGPPWEVRVSDDDDVEREARRVP